MRAIFKREFRACFQSVIGWLFLAATLAFYFLYFYVYNLSYGYPHIMYAVNAISFLFLITVPVLTMRVFAEERHTKTDQLILTAPVSIGKIVMGKYLALAAVFSIAAAVIGLSPLLLGRFGTVPYGENYAALLGFWMYGLTSIAVGTFVSSLTESQVISAVLTFVFLFLGYMMDGITQVISSSGNLLTQILNCYNLTAGMDRLLSGQLDLTAVVYYISLTGLFLFLTSQSIQKRRWLVSVKKIGIGIFNAGFSAAAVTAVIVLNLAADALPDTVTNFDLTKEKLYSVTDDTKQILSALDKEVELYVLSNESSQDEQFASTLKTFGELSGKIQVTYVDPAVSPNFYQKYTQEQIPANSVIAVCGKRSKVISYSDIYETQIDYQTYSSQTTGYDGEGQLTSAIQYVTNDDMQTVYEITGHGESPVSGSFKEAIEKMNLTLASINLLEADALPEDCEAVIIQGPESDFSKDDAQKIIDYLADGGKVLITAKYTGQPMENFKSILEAYGLELEEGMIAEMNQGNFYKNPFGLLPDITNDTITADVSDEYVFLPYAQGIAYPDESKEEQDHTLVYTQLLASSSQAVLKKDVQNMTSYEKEEGDLEGAFTVGISVTDSASQAQLIVYTSAEMFTDSADLQVAGNNAALFAASIRSLAGEEEASNLIVIPVKQYELQRLTIAQGTIILAGFLTTAALPLLLVVLGIFIWLKRRKA